MNGERKPDTMLITLYSQNWAVEILHSISMDTFVRNWQHGKY